MTDKAQRYGDLTHSGKAKREWLDHNDHVNLGYFLVAFDLGTETLYNSLGVGMSAIETFGDTVFTLETHVTYLNELKNGQEFSIRTKLMGYDHNKLHYIHSMFKAGRPDPIAHNECLGLNVNAKTKRPLEWRVNVKRRLADMISIELERPIDENILGRSVKQIGIPGG